MPIPTDRSAALARLRAYLTDPDRPPPSREDLAVLLNPNAQALALASANEELRGQVAAARAQIVELEEKVRALARDAT